MGVIFAVGIFDHKERQTEMGQIFLKSVQVKNRCTDSSSVITNPSEL